MIGGRRGWEEQVVYEAPIPGGRTFARRPTNENVLKFLKESEWMPHSLSAGSGVIEAAIGKRAWLVAIGAPPPVVLSHVERPKGSVSYY